jgi:hypothetical protein
MEQRSRYEYEPLTGSQEIRLIILKRNKRSSPLKCRIVHIELTPELPYLALSYTWGASSQTSLLLVDGQELNIRTNLWSALWHLREDMRRSSKCLDMRSFPQYMWIDAICINQDDIAERNHQVQLMRQVFGYASEVLVWLGIEADDSRLAMEVLQDVCESYNWSDALKAIARLFNREYWTRMWIIQEIGLAEKVTLRCGGQSVDWGSIKSIQSKLYIDSRTVKLATRIDQSHAMQLFRQWSNQKPHTSPRLWQSDGGHAGSLQGLLETFKDFKCSDPRDKVFALLGLASDCQNGELLPDYSKSILDVYVDVIYHCNTIITEGPPRKFVSFSKMLLNSLGLQSVNQKVIEKALELMSTAGRPLLQVNFYGCHYIQETGPPFERELLKSGLRVEHISIGPSNTNPQHLRSFPDLTTTSLHIGEEFWDDPGDIACVHSIGLENGSYGLAPVHVAKGDAICRLPGWHVAVVLRKCPNDQSPYFGSGPSHTIIGRAIIFPSESTLDTSNPLLVLWIRESKDEESGEPKDMLAWPHITFIDIATLYKLIS